MITLKNTIISYKNINKKVTFYIPTYLTWDSVINSN